MSVDCLKNFSLDDVRKARIDFTSGGTINFGDFVPSLIGDRCRVLQADKIINGDKSTTGSPISSHRGSSVHHDSGSSSSGSPIASPISYTQDLIGVDSPGLSGGAGSITPIRPTKENHQSPVSPLAPSASSSKLYGPVLPQPQNGLPRKSRFDITPEDLEREKKSSVPSTLPNGKRKASSSDEEKSENGEEEREKNGVKSGSLGSFVKRIKLETISTTTVKPPELQRPQPTAAAPSPLAAVSKPPPLIPRSVAAAAAAAKPTLPPKPQPLLQRPLVGYKDSDEEESEEEDDRVVGPQLPKSNGTTAKVNGESRPTSSLSRESSSNSLISAAAASAATTLGAAASAAKSNRKRLLSERGETELKYPIMEKEISSKWGWDGATWMGERKRGTGLINRANDCFLNVILQMITHTAPLARYLMERHKSDCKRESHQCVACALRDNHLVKTFRMQGPMETRWISQHLRRIFPSHSFGMQEDAHELLSLLLDAIDHPVGWNRENGNKELPNKLKPSTPIEQIFGGTLRNQVTCQSCHTPYINYERIRELNVALGRKQPDERVPLTSLVQDYFRNETIAAFSCKKCARKTAAVRQTRVLRAPAVLIVQLKRFNAYGGKIRQPIGAERELDLSKFTYDMNGDGEGGKNATYTLTGVVEHLGSTVDHGHYIAYAKSIDNSCWFKFDDEDVTKLNGYSNNPYLLFYSRKDLRPASKNGYSNGVSPSVSSSKLVQPSNGVKISNGNGMQNGISRPMNGGYNQNGNGYKAPYQNGGSSGPKLYNNYGTNGYSNKFNTFMSNGHNGQNKYNGGNNNHHGGYNNNQKWRNGGNRAIKTFQKPHHNGWNRQQHI